MSDPGFWLEEKLTCPNCGKDAEPEGTTDLRWWECTDPECGYEFGYARLPQPDSSCQLGVPAQVRRAASVPQRPQVFIPTIGRRPE